MKIDGTRSNDRAIEMVLGYYNAFNRRDWDGMLALLGEDVVHDVNQGPREIGKPAFAAFLQRMETRCREQLSDIVVMAAPDGNRAAAEYVVHGTCIAANPGPSSSPVPAPARGQEYVLPGGAFFDIRDGHIQRISNYSNPQAWIAQLR